MFKKILLSSLLVLTTISSAIACSSSSGGLTAGRNVYLAGINHFFTHLNGTTWVNGINGDYYQVSLPITPWFKINKNMIDSVSEMKLYYKIVEGTNNSTYNTGSVWRLAKSIDLTNVSSYQVYFGEIIKLFGDDVITSKIIAENNDTISKGDWIILLWWFSYVDLTASSGSTPPTYTNIDDIEENGSEPEINNFISTTSTGTYTPYLMIVKYNGMDISNIGR